MSDGQVSCTSFLTVCHHHKDCWVLTRAYIVPHRIHSARHDHVAFKDWIFQKDIPGSHHPHSWLVTFCYSASCRNVIHSYLEEDTGLHSSQISCKIAELLVTGNRMSGTWACSRKFNCATAIYWKKKAIDVWLVEQGLTSHSTQFRSFRRQVRWPNQQCQSTEGGWLVIQIALNLTRLISPCHNNTTCKCGLECNAEYVVK